jgi:hypothetical protein
VLFGNQSLYQQVRAAKKGRAQLPFVLAELQRWISNAYHVRVLYIEYDRIDIGPHQGRPRLQLFVETTSDLVVLQEDRLTLRPGVVLSIRIAFASILDMAETHEEYDAEDVHVVAEAFSKESVRRAVAKFLDVDRQRCISDVADPRVWDISGFGGSVVVFYATDRMVAEGGKSGLDLRVKQLCFNAIKAYDEFDYFTFEDFDLRFDSKENFDKNFRGSWFNYWR